MKPKYFRAWLIGSVFSSCTLGLIGAASAQSTTAPGAATQGLATINVVARKKTENLQKVPLSVTAIPAKVLKRAHVENLHDIAALTPGLNVADFGAETGTTITIRGDTDQTFGLNVPDVATFLDDTYLRDPNAVNIAAIPLADVEVIKGPVSALYGRDAYSGVIDYNIARPGTTPHADISETAGDYGKSELQGDVSGPIFGNKVLGEVFGDFDNFNGTYHDSLSGADAGGDVKKDIGALLDFNWTDDFQTHFDFYYGYDSFNNAAVERLDANCGSGTEIGPTGEPITAANQYCGQVKSNGSVQVGNDPEAGNPGNERRTFYGSMKNTLTLPYGAIEAVTGASQVDEQAIQLFDASSMGQPFQLAYAATPGVPNGNYADEHSFYGSDSNTANFSQELRYTSPQDQPIRFGAGGFFYSETRFDTQAASLSELGIPAGQVLYDANSYFATPTGAVGPHVDADKHTTDEEAGFANLEADILPNLTAATQYRYTWLHQHFTGIANEFGGPTVPPTSSEEEYFTTNESLRYFPIPNQMLYFAFANGVKPGGFNSGATIPADYSYAKESDESYEGGFKTELLDNALQLDATAYHINTSNLQLYTPTVGYNEVFKNFGNTTNTGFEVDARAMPVTGLTITGGFNYNNPTFDAGTLDAADAYNCAEVPSCSATEFTKKGLLEEPVAGHDVPLTSKYTFTATAEYDYTLMEKYPAFVRGDYSYHSSQFTDSSNLTSIGGASDLDFFTGASYGPYSLTVYVKNITNDQTPVFFQYDTTLDYYNKLPTVVLPPSRTFAFTLAAKF